MIEKLRQSKEVYSKDEILTILKEFNNISLNIYNFANKYSCRSSYIHLGEIGMFFEIYLDNQNDFSLKNKEMFEIINLNKWLIYKIGIAFDNEIKITVLVNWNAI